MSKPTRLYIFSSDTFIIIFFTPSPATHVPKLDKAIAVWILERYNQLRKQCVNAIKKLYLIAFLAQSSYAYSETSPPATFMGEEREGSAAV